MLLFKRLQRTFYFYIILSLSLVNFIVTSSSVPDPLPEVCYSGGVESNPCRGTACAPCWLQMPDGKWSCFDLLPDGTCQFGENVGDRIKNRNSNSLDNSSSANVPTPTQINNGNQKGTVGVKKYSSTTTKFITMTISGSIFIQYSYYLILMSILFIYIF